MRPKKNLQAIKERPPHSMMVLTIILHVCSIILSGAMSFWIWGSVRAFFCVGAFIFSALLSLYLWKRYGVLDRKMLWRAARISGYWVWGMSIFGYVALYHTMPQSFSFSSKALWLIAPCIALAPAVAALIIMLCAGDIILFIFEEEKDSSPKSF